MCILQWLLYQISITEQQKLFMITKLIKFTFHAWILVTRHVATLGLWMGCRRLAANI